MSVFQPLNGQHFDIGLLPNSILDLDGVTLVLSPLQPCESSHHGAMIMTRKNAYPIVVLVELDREDTTTTTITL